MARDVPHDRTRSGRRISRRKPRTTLSWDKGDTHDTVDEFWEALDYESPSRLARAVYELNKATERHDDDEGIGGETGPTG
jgi:hypothetical protein